MAKKFNKEIFETVASVECAIGRGCSVIRIDQSLVEDKVFYNMQYHLDKNGYECDSRGKGNIYTYFSPVAQKTNGTGVSMKKLINDS